MKTFLTLFFICYTVSAAKHSLKFLLTETSGETNFTEFDGIATLDNVELGHCDNINVKAKPKQDWEMVKQRPTHIDWYTHNCVKTQHILKVNLNNLKQHLNQTEGLHVLQRMNGCEWDDESNEVTGFIQFGYDGEDLLTLDLQTKTWTSPKAQADVKKYLGETDKRGTDLMKAFLMSECPDLLQTYLRSEKSFLQRTERPSVSFLQKTPSSPVCCHATGFYPDRADLFWRKDGEEIHEGVENGQILPNHDGTFQMSSELNVSLIKHEDWRRYDCVFQLSGLTEDIVSMLDKTQIQTNWVSPSEFPVGPVVGGAAGVVLLLVISGVLYCCWRNRNDGLEKEESSSGGSKASQEGFSLAVEKLICTKNTQKH